MTTPAQKSEELSRVGSMIAGSNPLAPLNRPPPAARGPPTKEDLFMPWSGAKAKELVRSKVSVPQPLVKAGRIQKIDAENLSVYEEDGRVVFVIDEAPGTDDAGVKLPGGHYVVRDLLMLRMASRSDKARELIRRHVSDADIASRFPGLAPAAQPPRAASSAQPTVQLVANVPFGPALKPLSFSDVLSTPMSELRGRVDFQPFATSLASNGFGVYPCMNENAVREILNSQFLEQRSAHPDTSPMIGKMSKL